MKNTGTILFFVLLILNMKCAYTWWGCGPQYEGDGCSAFCPCEDGLKWEAFHHKCRRPGNFGESCHATKPCGHSFTCQPGVHK